MNKEDILKAFPDYEEITQEEYQGFPLEAKCLTIVEDDEDDNMETIYLKPKPKFPIVFENEVYSISILKDGEIKISTKGGHAWSTYHFSVNQSLPLLEQAIAKSKEIRGLK
jgi:hypothetical protein